MKKIHMTPAQAGGFYIVHKERPFYGELCEFMSSGPCVVLAMEGDDIIAKNRELMGETDSTKAKDGTIGLGVRGLTHGLGTTSCIRGSPQPE